MGDFKELKVWRAAHRLTLDLYPATDAFPHRETYGLVAQLRSAGVSVEANIAEGSGRQGDAEFARFLVIARASVTEIECELLIARDLGYVPTETWQSLDTSVKVISRMLNALIGRLRRRRT